jgi:FkbM family methyltransferase
MGNALERAGIYDLAVTETVFRVLGSGDTAIDVGGNVGYMTSIMARRVGPEGRVITFEPQPDVFARLESNIETWRDQDPSIGEVSPHRLALSDVAATRSLHVPADRDDNHERASLREFKFEHRSIEVQTKRLDEVALPEGAIALLKIDTERHELEVLRGAHLTLPAVRTVVAEEHTEPPTPVSEILADEGFSLFTVLESFRGPKLHALAPALPHVGWGPPNLIATRDPDALEAALRPRGWRSLGSRNPLNLLLTSSS